MKTYMQYLFLIQSFWLDNKNFETLSFMRGKQNTIQIFIELDSLSQIQPQKATLKTLFEYLTIFAKSKTQRVDSPG